MRGVAQTVALALGTLGLERRQRAPGAPSESRDVARQPHRRRAYPWRVAGRGDVTDQRWDGAGRRAAIPLALLVLALLVRAHALGAQSLWFDEAWQVWYSSLPVRTIVTLLPQNDTAPPLYYALLHGWMGLVGRSEVAVRFPSTLLGALAVPLVYAVGRDVAGRSVALLAALLVLVNPFHIWYSQEARAYAPVATVALGAAWCAVRWVETARPRWGVLVAIADVVLLYAQSTALLFVAAQVAYVGVALARRYAGAWDGSVRARARARALWPVAAALALWLPWVPSLLRQQAHGQTDWIPYVTLGDGLDFLRQGTGTGRWLPLPGQDGVRYGVEALLLVLAALSLRKGWREALLLLGPALLLFTLALHAHVWAPRAALVAVFGLALLAARGLTRLPRAATLGLAGVVVAINLATLTHGPTRAPWRELAALLCAQARPGDVLAVAPPYTVAALAYYTVDRRCPAVILSPRYRLPATWRSFRDAYFLSPMQQDEAAWLHGAGPASAAGVARRLAAGRARLWIVGYDGATGPDAAPLFAVQDRPSILFHQGGLVLARSRISAVRAG